MTLTDALDEMVTNGVLTPSIAMKVLAQFDKVRSSPILSAKHL
jgi:transcription initiation factor TFIIA small subunit